MPKPRPTQVPGEEYSMEDESLFRREIENTLLEIAFQIDLVESGASRKLSLSSRKISLHTPPVGQVEVG